MSRGLGRTQRAAVRLLWRHPDEAAGGVPLAELKRTISTDRSNARRAIRGLVDRGLLEVGDEEGVRRVKLTGGGQLACVLAALPDDQSTLRYVPSKPLDLDLLYDEDPHGCVDTSWMDAAAHDPAVGDPEATDNERGHPMRLGKPHAPSSRLPDRGVRDPPPYTPGIDLEIAARMAREALERLDEEEGA
jgi:hypothetical protein